jgi:hypothetical protein
MPNEIKNRMVCSSVMSKLSDHTRAERIMQVSVGQSYTSWIELDESVNDKIDYVRRAVFSSIRAAFPVLKIDSAKSNRLAQVLALENTL